MEDDIFEGVDEILSADPSSPVDEEKSFNESELHDIMSEIEDLEKEFEAESSPMTLQQKIDAELEMEMEEATAVSSPAPTMAPTKVTAPAAQVLPFEKPTTNPMANKLVPTQSGVSFSAQGQMALNLDFKVGEDNAKLTVDPMKGLMVTMSGVEICINEDSGCTLTMENGMTFTIPLSSKVNSPKKKTA